MEQERHKVDLGHVDMPGGRRAVGDHGRHADEPRLHLEHVSRPRGNRVGNMWKPNNYI